MLNYRFDWPTDSLFTLLKFGQKIGSPIKHSTPEVLKRFRYVPFVYKWYGSVSINVPIMTKHVQNVINAFIPKLYKAVKYSTR